MLQQRISRPSPLGEGLGVRLFSPYSGPWIGFSLILYHLQQVGNLLQSFHQWLLHHTFNKGV